MKPATNAQIRTFHLTGLGLDHLAANLPLAPMPESPSLRELFAKALHDQRGQARERFFANVRYCRDRMRELLSLDDQRDPEVSASPSAIKASMGAASSFFDSGSLAVALRTALSPVSRMNPARRRRCEATLETLSNAVDEAEKQPEYWEFPAADAGAIAFCERQLDQHVEILRAVRVARLEMQSAYDESIHDDLLARFGWESADREELAAMPAVLVMDSAENFADKSLTTFARLLRSGLPMQILLTCAPFYTGDLGFLAVSHREAFVLQSSTACPEHLSAGLLDMTQTLRPAVAVVSTGDTALFHQSRTFPMYVYNPEAGEGWIDRFDLYREPLPRTEVTAVHVAAAYPDWQRHFRVLPTDCWSEEQMELSAYLAQYRTAPPLAVPFVSLLDHEGREQRAVITRELVQIARDRQRAWKLLSELAEAGKPAPPLIDTGKIRQEGEKEAFLRVVSMLTGGGVPAPTPAAVVSSAAPAETNASTVEIAADPYVDSSLCTSCNDCTKINSRMFQYNADKQAYIADANAGTFAELVKAAEGCPARCIHPGIPRPDDRTATPQWLGRAAKFNA
ncbi:MAG TPA: ferredoxin [Bryobacteraceae bacterium]|nr:ferredoxin [Bryobacteraceae bacterium]